MLDVVLSLAIEKIIEANVIRELRFITTLTTLIVRLQFFFSERGPCSLAPGEGKEKVVCMHEFEIPQ